MEDFNKLHWMSRLQHHDQYRDSVTIPKKFTEKLPDKIPFVLGVSGAQIPIVKIGEGDSNHLISVERTKLIFSPTLRKHLGANYGDEIEFQGHNNILIVNRITKREDHKTIEKNLKNTWKEIPYN